jgi:hypothetical protein
MFGNPLIYKPNALDIDILDVERRVLRACRTIRVEWGN